MAHYLLTKVRDQYRYAVISEDDIHVLMDRLEGLQSDLLGKNKRLKPVVISLCKPHNDQTRRYVNIGDGHITLIRVNDCKLTNKSK